MLKVLKISAFVLATFIIFALLVTQTNVGRKYYSGIARRVNAKIYKNQRKPSPTVKLNVPFFRQEHSLSCEFAALRMALANKGINVSESELINQAGREPMWGNPYRGYVGDINGKMFKTGYGIYWGPISSIGSNYRSTQAVEKQSASFLASQIQNGNPVIVWGYAGSGRRKKWRAPDGASITGVSGEHARVAFGFSGSAAKPTGFYLMDPIYGEIYWSASKLTSNWRVLWGGVVVR